MNSQDSSFTLQARKVVWLFGAHMSSNGSSASESLESSSSLTELALIAARTHDGCYIGRRTQHHTVGVCVCAKPRRLIFCMLSSYTTPHQLALPSSNAVRHHKTQIRPSCRLPNALYQVSVRATAKVCLPGTFRAIWQRGCCALAFAYLLHGFTARPMAGCLRNHALVSDDVSARPGV